MEFNLLMEGAAVPLLRCFRRSTVIAFRMDRRENRALDREEPRAAHEREAFLSSSQWMHPTAQPKLRLLDGVAIEDTPEAPELTARTRSPSRMAGAKRSNYHRRWEHRNQSDNPELEQCGPERRLSHQGTPAALHALNLTSLLAVVDWRLPPLTESKQLALLSRDRAIASKSLGRRKGHASSAAPDDELASSNSALISAPTAARLLATCHPSKAKGRAHTQAGSKRAAAQFRGWGAAGARAQIVFCRAGRRRSRRRSRRARQRSTTR